MGNDGGSIPDRRDLVKSKPKAEQADKANQSRARWFFCALSKAILAEPVVSCALGKLYNKDSLLEYLLDKTAFGDGEVICGHVRGMKDVKTLNLTPNPAPSTSTVSDNATARSKWVCPLTFKEMTGQVPFVYLSTCGCVFSRAGLMAVASPKKSASDSPLSSSSTTSPTVDTAHDSNKSKDEVKDTKEEQKQLCPNCAAKFTSSAIVAINPSEDEELTLRFALDATRILEAASKKEKKDKLKSKKRKAEAVTSDRNETASTAVPEDDKAAKKAKVTHAPAPTMSAASRALAAGLAMEEAKRKTNMSDAVKSLYQKDGARKQTWATMGTFTRYA